RFTERDTGCAMRDTRLGVERAAASAEQCSSLASCIPLVEAPFREGGVDVTLLAAPDLEAVIDDDLDLERPPYWALIWPSALALARFLIRTDALCRGKRVLELGCGAGLAGIVAAALGARVLQTD